MFIKGQTQSVPYKVTYPNRVPATEKTVTITVRDPDGTVRVNAETCTEVGNGVYNYPVLFDKDGVWLCDGDCADPVFHETKAIIVGAEAPPKVNAYFPYLRKDCSPGNPCLIGDTLLLNYGDSFGGLRLDYLSVPGLRYINDNGIGGSYAQCKPPVIGGVGYFALYDGGYLVVQGYDLEGATTAWGLLDAQFYGLTTDGTYLYCLYRLSDTMYIDKIDVSTMTTTSTWTGTVDHNCYSLCYADGFLYIIDYLDGPGVPLKISVSSMTTAVTSSEAYDLQPYNAVSDGTYVYFSFAAYGDPAIVKLDVSTLEEVDTWSAPTPSYFPVYDLILDEGFLYAATNYGVYKINATTMSQAALWETSGSLYAICLLSNTDYLLVFTYPIGVYVVPKHSLPALSGLEMPLSQDTGSNFTYSIGNLEDPIVFNPTNYASLMSYIKGLVAVPYPKPDLIINQVGPGLNTWYYFTQLSGKIHLESISVRVEDTDETLEVLINFGDGTVYSETLTCTAGVDYFVKRLKGTNGTDEPELYALDAEEQPILPNGMDVSYLYVGVRKVTNNGTGTLRGRIVYGQASSTV